MTSDKDKISIIGLGVSGLAAAKRLARAGEKVFVSEEKPRAKIDKNILRKFNALKVASEFGRHSKKVIENSKLIVVSPGVDLEQDIFRQAKKRNIPVISEIELAYSLLKKPIIAITGTNGKTTTVALTAQLLKAGGFSTIAAGNIGYPLIGVDDTKLDCIVAEISSYQLEGIINFKPWISALLNITPDHLLRHKSMKRYTASKARIFENQDVDDFFIYNADDNIARGISRNARCAKIPFTVHREPKNGIYLKKGSILSDILGKKHVICRTSEIYIKGLHNVQNCLAAVSIAMICGVSIPVIRRVLRTFRGVEHRIEHVRDIKGVSFYNDSKGTNPDSTIVAINALYPKKKLVLILGGRDKKTSLSQLSRLVKRKVRSVVLIGEAAGRFRKSLSDAGYTNMIGADSLKSAVKRSFELAQKGDAVLLSPACASFDMFKNYEERGRIFKNIVNGLRGNGR